MRESRVLTLDLCNTSCSVLNPLKLLACCKTMPVSLKERKSFSRYQACWLTKSQLEWKFTCCSEVRAAAYAQNTCKKAWISSCWYSGCDTPTKRVKETAENTRHRLHNCIAVKKWNLISFELQSSCPFCWFQTHGRKTVAVIFEKAKEHLDNGERCICWRNCFCLWIMWQCLQCFQRRKSSAATIKDNLLWTEMTKGKRKGQ